MQVSNPNNIKIYNLSAGKSLPEWLSDRRKRSLQKTDIDVQRRIELLQDFEMPTVSNCVQVSKDKQYIYATGVYKPRLKCYDVNQMSLKFERCFDATVVKFISLSDDYSKLIFLMDDRTVEFHAQHGRYYRTRIPKFGRDLAYHDPSCDLYVIGASSEVYRLNLEQGRFLSSLQTNASELNCCEFNPVHHLFSCGTTEGHVESWDPRTRGRVGKLDCAINTYIEDLEIDGVPAVTSIKYKDALNMAVGTSTGQILLYDIRTNRPYTVKDHNYGLPIKNIEFHSGQDLVLSLDPKILKIWNRQTGKPFTAIEPGTDLNDLCVCPDTGMLFLANEAPKILTYYIPALGPAPRWCSFLDNLTEELEENPVPTVYDDYKFVTRRELEELGLAHLIGSSLLRAYMHGFFMDVRLYHKAKAIVEPFAYDDYRRNKIREKIEETRANRVQIKKKLPKVNRTLAEKLMEQSEETELNKRQKIKQKEAVNLLKDDRFSAMFANPDFQVDEQSEEYRLLNPVVSKLDKQRQKKREKLKQQFEEVEDEELEGRPSSDDSSSDDDHTWTEDVKKQHRLLTHEARMRERAEREQDAPKFYEMKEGKDFNSIPKKKKKKESKISLGDRVEMNKDTDVITQTGMSLGSREMTFHYKKDEKNKHREMEAAAHHKERRKIRRSAADITKTIKSKPKYWMGKRVQ